MNTLLTRREFLHRASTAGLTLALSVTPGYRLVKAEEMKTTGLSFNPSVWVQITPDNIVTFTINKSEMGQGVSTSLPMIIADELEADWKQVRFGQAPAGPKYVDPQSGMQLTGGSSSVKHMYEPLRQAGAAAREMLVRAAAQTWGAPAKDCEAVQGTVRHKKTGKSLTYGQLCERASKLPIPRKPSLKRESQFKFIGSSKDRLDIPDKVNGSAIFGMDVSVPGMVYAAIARPPVFGGKAVSYDKEAAEKIPGVTQVTSIRQGIAVTATSLEAAWKARKALRVKWDQGTHPELDGKQMERTFIDQLENLGIVARDHGNIKDGLSKSVKKLEATYTLPYLAHVTMEPINCAASVGPDRCEIWISTQNQSGVLQLASRVTGLKEDQIHVHTPYLGGGFGRRGDAGYVEEPLLISRATGKPVKIIWTREEDIQNDVFRPGSCCRITGGVDEKGNLVAWSHKVVVPSIFERFAPQRMKDGVDPAAVEGIVDRDYEIPNLYVEYVKMDNPIPVGFWRSVGNSINAFTGESFMDELAHAAGQDPLEFRLNHLKYENHLPARRLLEVAAEKAGWKKTPKRGQALGIAYHFCFGTRVAEAAEVSVNEKDGTVTVHKVVCAVDCGPVVVNPAIVTAQMKGAIIMGLSAALHEKVDFEKGGVASANFYNYHELRMSEIPEIEVHILKSKGPMGGIGEPGLPPIAPAVSNAVFAATGKRIRRLPIRTADA